MVLNKYFTGITEYMTNISLTINRKTTYLDFWFRFLTV